MSLTTLTQLCFLLALEVRILQEKEEVEETYHGMRFWKWRRVNETIGLDHLEIKDFAVLLPKYGKNSTLGAGDKYTLW
jgi:hypothetical protein